MSKYIGPLCRLCRREQFKLYLKGERCESKCPLDKTKSRKSKGVPGAKGSVFRRRLTDYGVQLREKQKLKRHYLITENQFSNYIKRASKMEGTKGDNLFSLLESRFDVAVYRSGLARSKKEARQMVNHGFFNINQKPVDIPSYILKKGDVIEFRKTIVESDRGQRIKEAVEEIQETRVPSWLNLNKELMSVSFSERPSGGDIKELFFPELKINLIIEYYSR